MKPYYIYFLATVFLMVKASDEQNSASSRITYVQQVKSPIRQEQVRLCVDFEPIAQLIHSQLEPLLEPVVDLLPEFYQIVLKEKTKLKINISSCIFLSLITFIFLSSWYFISRSLRKKRLSSELNYQCEIIALNLRTKELSLENELLVTQAVDSNSKLDTAESLLDNKEILFNELNDKYLNLKNLNQTLKEQIDSMNLNETTIKLEMENLKLSKESIENNQIVSNTLIDKLNSQIDEFKILEAQLKQDLVAKQASISKLELALASKPNLDCINQECGKKISNLKIEIENLESKTEQYRQINVSNRSELDQKDLLIKNLETKLEKSEHLLKESEMQIKLLNDLREKDTKQHIKSLSEMDMELKKKSCESEKISHLYEQLRIKQERVQDLEIQLSKMEKQWNTERQTFEKHVHENWLNGKKVEKELKDTKLELNTLKDRFNDLLAETNQLKQHNKYYYQVDTSLSESKADQPLQIDTNQIEISRPSSATSSSSGINSGIGGPHMPAFYGNFPFKHPYTSMSSPNPDFSQIPRMPFNYAAYQQIMYKMMMQSRSACSSQLPSPCPNFPTSASYPNSLNDSMLRNGNQVLNDDKSETNEHSNV